MKERERAKNESSARDSKIAGLFDELAAAQAEMQEARGKVDQVSAEGPKRVQDILGTEHRGSKLTVRLEAEGLRPMVRTDVRMWLCWRQYKRGGCQLDRHDIII